MLKRMCFSTGLYGGLNDVVWVVIRKGVAEGDKGLAVCPFAEEAQDPRELVFNADFGDRLALKLPREFLLLFRRIRKSNKRKGGRDGNNLWGVSGMSHWRRGGRGESGPERKKERKEEKKN